MKKLRLILFVIAVISITNSYAQQPSSVLNTWDDERFVALWAWGDAKGRTYDYKVSREVLSKVAEWLPEKDNPPLGIPQAVAIAKKTAHADYPKYSDFILRDFKVMQAVSQKYRNRWFYVIELNPQLDGEIQFRSDVKVVILMDGTVVKPIEAKRPEHWMGGAEQVVPPDRQESAPASR